ncbi:SOS response-associated peptidase [Chryseolinea lacunae]|uniref:Abasic site processing protein n=1 Tax=Chryseolinea lacunae TaxID=2801331 RepID=A0ABS1L340_9BACT|nr:SOS response-associated peptidase [Chryseolinea lacunae]MBL0744966.1 SOS response-associated peptidase [Chryseolinea lacunae]
MIERYSVTASAEKIKERFLAEALEAMDARYNAAPTHLLPVITQSAPQGVSTFYWGTSPGWAKNKTPGEKIINLRAETILEKPALKKAMMKSRCLIPADSFYAWKKVGKKTSIPYRFMALDQELFSFAGVWEEFEDTDGNQFHTFSMITTPANEMVATVQDRMPAMLTPASEKIWLNNDSTEEELMAVLVSYPAEKTNYYPVSPRINDINANVPSLIIPTPPSDQFGNLTLFD